MTAVHPLMAVILDRAGAHGVHVEFEGPEMITIDGPDLRPPTSVDLEDPCSVETMIEILSELVRRGVPYEHDELTKSLRPVLGTAEAIKSLASPAERWRPDCPTPAKRRYPDRATAVVDLDRIMLIAATSRVHIPSRAYPCSCRGWHLTSRPLRFAGGNISADSVTAV